jgi:hypothetical protein
VGVVDVLGSMKKWLEIDVGTLDHCMNGAEVYYKAVKNLGSGNVVKNPRYVIVLCLFLINFAGFCRCGSSWRGPQCLEGLSSVITVVFIYP